MRRLIILGLIISQICWIIIPSFAQNNFDFIITKTSGNKLVANKGENQNIKLNQQYYIFRNGDQIGTACVIILKSNICGLIQLSGDKAYAGDNLQLKSTDQSDSDIFQEMDQVKTKYEKNDTDLTVFGAFLSIAGIITAIVGLNHSEKIKVQGYTIAEKNDPDETLIAVGALAFVIGVISIVSTIDIEK